MTNVVLFSAKGNDSMHAVLEYTYGPDYLKRRELFRAAHLELAWRAVDAGSLVLGGAVGTGPFSGLLIFQGDDPVELARGFAANDPYVLEGVVESWTVRPWTTVVGHDAATPVRADG